MPTPPKDRAPRGKGSQRHEHRVQGRMAQFIAGEITVEDLDDEELMRGRIRDINGKFSGPKPKLIPREFHDALVRELLKRGDQLLRENFLMAMDTFFDIAGNKALEPKDRLKAAQYLWERVAGKVPDKVELKAEIAPWQEDIKEIVAKEPDEEQRASRRRAGSGE